MNKREKIRDKNKSPGKPLHNTTRRPHIYNTTILRPLKLRKKCSAHLRRTDDFIVEKNEEKVRESSENPKVA